MKQCFNNLKMLCYNRKVIENWQKTDEEAPWNLQVTSRWYEVQP